MPTNQPNHKPTDPIYRDSAMALESLSAKECSSWVQTLLDICTQPETQPEPFS